MQLKNKRIILAISGGIAAYKCPEIVRRLRDLGADIKVVMTDSAQEFITPLTLQAVSGMPVLTELLDAEAESAMGHIELARWADLCVIAPATSNTIAKLAQGIADNLLTTLMLATPAPVAVCPAMNQQMYHHGSTQHNLTVLRDRHVDIWGPNAGSQACGDVGLGRMLEPSEIVERIEQYFQPKMLQGKRMMITAGPTQEPLDPVRYLSNKSSGKMGFALAEQASRLGAEVHLIAGPVSLNTPANVSRTNVVSAVDMHQAVMSKVADIDIFIGCAAVADYRPVDMKSQKIKKDSEKLSIDFIKNPDILYEVAHHSARPWTVGFAAETEHLRDYALGKLKNKNLDMIAANQVSDARIGFDSEHNALQVFWRDGEHSLPYDSKTSIARELLQLIAKKVDDEKTS